MFRKGISKSYHIVNMPMVLKSVVYRLNDFDYRM